MKIGILTFHFSHNNFGAQLQAYGLSKCLQNMGYDAEIIDYRLRYIYRWQEVDNIRSYYNNQREDGFTPFRSLLRTLRYYPKLKGAQKVTKNWGRYDNFMTKVLPLSHRVYSWQLDKLKYDAIICGSDQIWNIDLTGGVSGAYFLTFKGNHKRIAYAGSTGTDGFDFGEEEKIKNALCKFNALSCREENLTNSVRKLTQRDVTTVCDPVFLLNKDEWKKILLPSLINEPYILVYSTCEKNDTVLRTAKKLSKKYKFRIVRVTNNMDDRYSIDENYLDAGPQEFLTLVDKAAFVVSNTFHGLATSVVLNKQFYLVLPSLRVDRVMNIVNRFGIQSRIVDEKIDLDNSTIDYDLVNERVDEYRKLSLDYLQKALNS